MNLSRASTKLISHEIKGLFKQAEEGILDDPVATLESGQSTMPPEIARVKMLDIVKELKPDYDPIHEEEEV